MTADSGLRQVRKVHVAPLGYEYDRIEVPVREYGADVLYLITGSDRDRTPYHDRLEADLTDRGVSVRTREVRLDDVYDVLGEITTIVDHHADDIVRVNVSSGPKLAAVGAALACMATDATGYHVHPEEQAHPVEETPRTEGMALAEPVPSYPMETPTADQVRILAYLDGETRETYTPKKSDLISFAEDEELEFLVRSDPANEKAKFALLNNRIVEPLVEKGYVDIEPVGRTKQVTLTETGENALRAFRHML